MQKKIMVIFGTRPEATKMCPVVQSLKKHPEWFETQLVVTGQHREQLYHALDNFSLKPDVDLSLMKDNQSLAYITSSAIAGLDEHIKKSKPDMILVHGDTMTSFCGAITGFFHKVTVGHVEAGLRTGNKYSPWPEEINRRLVDVTSDLLFAPTKNGCDNLLKESYDRKNIYITGQTAVDAALFAYSPSYIFSLNELNNIDYLKQKVIMVTAHRKENYGEPMNQMFTAIRRIADQNPEVLIVYPVHLSPVVRSAANSILSGHDRIKLLEPIDFKDSINLQARSYMIMSDSGGLQEESVVFNKPLVLMRDTTERPEAVDAGAVYLAGTNEESIYDITEQILNDKLLYKKMSSAKNPFGDGKASDRICSIIAHHFEITEKLPDEFA